MTYPKLLCFYAWKQVLVYKLCDVKVCLGARMVTEILIYRSAVCWEAVWPCASTVCSPYPQICSPLRGSMTLCQYCMQSLPTDLQPTERYNDPAPVLGGGGVVHRGVPVMDAERGDAAARGQHVPPRAPSVGGELQPHRVVVSTVRVASHVQLQHLSHDHFSI